MEKMLEADADAEAKCLTWMPEERRIFGAVVRTYSRRDFFALAFGGGSYVLFWCCDVFGFWVGNELEIGMDRCR